MKRSIVYFGKIAITTPDTLIINIKSVSSWGDGIYYSKTANAKSFSKSLYIDDVVGFSGTGIGFSSINNEKPI